MNIRDKFAERVLKETGYVIEGRCKYHTNTQRSETGIVCYYNAHLQGYENEGNYFVMLNEGVKVLMNAKEWSFIKDSEGVEIFIKYQDNR